MAPETPPQEGNRRASAGHYIPCAQEREVLLKRQEPLPREGEGVQQVGVDALRVWRKSRSTRAISKERMEPKTEVLQAGDDERNAARGVESKGRWTLAMESNYSMVGSRSTYFAGGSTRRERGREIGTRTSSVVRRVGCSKEWYLIVSYESCRF